MIAEKFLWIPDKAGCTNVTITGNTAKTKGSSRFDISLSAGVSKCTVMDNKIYERGIYAADKTSNVLARNARPISAASKKITCKVT